MSEMLSSALPPVLRLPRGKSKGEAEAMASHASCVSSINIVQPNRQHSLLLLSAIVLVALLLAPATLVAGVRGGVIEPALGSVSLGPLSVGATIENRICLQRVLRRACAPPVYTLTLRLESARGIQHYQLLHLPISERYAFYP